MEAPISKIPSTLPAFSAGQESALRLRGSVCTRAFTEGRPHTAIGSKKKRFHTTKISTGKTTVTFFMSVLVTKIKEKYYCKNKEFQGLY
jgi:hypothetical protein